MSASIDIKGVTYAVSLDDAVDISIPMVFNGPQPNAYGVEPAVSKAVESGDLVGDTRRGGSVNFEQYTFIPHCSGTHTECVGHITHERISIRNCLRDVIIPAILITVEPESSPNSTDLVIGKAAIEDAVRSSVLTDSALIVRTTPNSDEKLTREYGTGNSAVPPYFTLNAMQYMVDTGVTHLLVDMPSIDRIFDEGRLLNHRIFWNVEEGSFEVNAETRTTSTITEMIYVPNKVEDGEYLLNFQIAPFESDTAPSRPLLLKNL